MAKNLFAFVFLCSCVALIAGLPAGFEETAGENGDIAFVVPVEDESAGADLESAESAQFGYGGYGRRGFGGGGYGRGFGGGWGGRGFGGGYGGYGHHHHGGYGRRGYGFYG